MRAGKTVVVAIVVMGAVADAATCCWRVQNRLLGAKVTAASLPSSLRRALPPLPPLICFIYNSLIACFCLRTCLYESGQGCLHVRAWVCVSMNVNDVAELEAGNVYSPWHAN